MKVIPWLRKLRLSACGITQNLRAFELADEVSMLVYGVTAGFPKEELVGLTSQIRRAAVSVPSNILEGGVIRVLRDV